MKLRNIAWGIPILFATSIWAQNGAPQTPAAATAGAIAASQSTAPVTRMPRPFRNRIMRSAPGTQQSASPALEARLEAMEDTLAKMHALLADMQHKAGGKGQTAAADNLRMWELLLGHLDRTFSEARMSMQRSLMYQRSMPGQNPESAPRSPFPLHAGAAVVPPASPQQ